MREVTTEPAAHPACAECGERHGPAYTCKGAVNYEWHVIASNRAIVRANKRKAEKR